VPKGRRQPDASVTVSSLSPLGIVNAAMRAVPALKYALGLAAIAVLGSIVLSLLGSVHVAAVVVSAMLIGMMLLFVFARLVTTGGPAVIAASVVLVWVTVLFFCTFLVFTASAIAVRWPKPWAELLLPAPPAGPAIPDTVLFDNWNGEKVDNMPTAPVKFVTHSPYYISYIANYHWNHGIGEAQGYIGLRDDTGTDYGPWESLKSSGQGGASNTDWEVRPNTIIPAGTYTVIDSHPESWSQNPRSGGMGFSKVEGHPAD
jgi:hypothetical protein